MTSTSRDSDEGSAEEPTVLVLNGGSSSGKSTLARCLQEMLDGYWFRLGVDTLIDAAPPRLLAARDGLTLADDGTVGVGPDFAEADRQWTAGIAAMAMAGAHIIIEDNFLGGPASQQRWRVALRGLSVGWVGVRCAAEVAMARENTRGDRVEGMAGDQAEAVHRGIDYDLEVDTTASDPSELAKVVQKHFFS